MDAKPGSPRWRPRILLFPFFDVAVVDDRRDCVDAVTREPCACCLTCPFPFCFLLLLIPPLAFTFLLHRDTFSKRLSSL